LSAEVKNPALPRGASSKKKPFSLWAILFKIAMAIHPRSSERGILAFSREEPRSSERGILAFSRKFIWVE
jgi:hypothetical protein